MIEEQSEQLVVLLYTLNSGLQRTANLSRVQVKEFIENYKIDKKYVCTSYNETYGFNPDLIADFKVIDLYQKVKTIIHIENIDEEIIDEIEKSDEELSSAYQTVLSPFKIDCKCGATYVVEISSAKTKGKCNGCHEWVYVDRSIGQIDTYKGRGWLMTNKYFVQQ